MKTFEELPVWQDGRELVKEVYALTRRPGFRNDSGLCDQIQRAAVSICSNIAEGHERGSTPDLIQYLFFAKGSAGEVCSQLYHAEDLSYAGHGEAKRLREMARGISRQLSSWIQSMQGLSFKAGPKFHKEPDRAMEKFWSKLGMVKGEDGRMRKRETEDGRRKDGKRKDGRWNVEDGRTEGGMTDFRFPVFRFAVFR